ncbi:hypothetical protein HPB47_006477 [Ixodes persulcatus]|uniref:Uncharacterized protein n=1 Tax=Ixodes persulcatus TaxID=34615 RepID=A0AC60PAT6_IXOPE|nr:hypothetical protein HPB47_006477 [Ixodes persulcatus]
MKAAFTTRTSAIIYNSGEIRRNLRSRHAAVFLEWAISGRTLRFAAGQLPVHTSRHVKETLEDLSVPQLPCPAKSPDLNIIENVRGIMKRNLSKRKLHHAFQEELWDAACEEWGKLRESPNLSPIIYDSLPKRLRDVLSTLDEATRY